MDTFRSIPGLPGLYVAGVFSAALRCPLNHIYMGPHLYTNSSFYSSLSTFLNASALIILEDFVRPFHPNLSEKLATKITKFVSVVFGCLGFGFVFAFSNVKTILDVSQLWRHFWFLILIFYINKLLSKGNFKRQWSRIWSIIGHIYSWNAVSMGKLYCRKRIN